MASIEKNMKFMKLEIFKSFACSISARDRSIDHHETLIQYLLSQAAKENYKRNILYKAFWWISDRN